MAIVINDVTLPDIPSDVLASYPYGVILSAVSSTDETAYLLVVLNSSVFHGDGSLFGMTGTDGVGSFGAGATYYVQLGGDAWTSLGAVATGEFVTALGVVDSNTVSLVWANHNIYELTSYDSTTGEYTTGSIWFAKSVETSDEELVATHFYYNTVLLPEIPEDVLKTHPYAWIRTNSQTGYYDLLMSSSPWWQADSTTITTANYAEGIQWYRVLISGSAYEWDFNQSWTESGDFAVDTNRPILWSNHNIPVGSVSASEIYFNGSTPIPVVESYDIRRDSLAAIANQVRRLCGTSESLTPARMQARLAGLNIELQAARVCSSSEEQVIYPDEGYYGFSSITVEAVESSGTSGGGTSGDGGDDSGGDSGETSYNSWEDSALTYEATTTEVPTGRYFYGRYSRSLPAFPGKYPYRLLYSNNSILYIYEFPVEVYYSNGTSKFYNVGSDGLYQAYKYDSTSDTWVLAAGSYVSFGVKISMNYTYWSNFDICDSSGNVIKAATALTPETTVTETYAPTATDAIYTVTGDTVASLGATVYQITGEQASTPEEMIAALNYYAALNTQTTEEETTE